MFFFNDTATTEIYTLSLHDALPICVTSRSWDAVWVTVGCTDVCHTRPGSPLNVIVEEVPVVLASGTALAVGLSTVKEEVADRKSTRLNSSHANISYAVFCLKKK